MTLPEHVWARVFQTVIAVCLLEVPLVTCQLTATQSSPKELTYSINEESEVGSFIGNLKLDAERKFLIPYNELHHFELYDGSGQGLFRVELNTGKLFVAERIDRETLCPQSDILPPSMVANPIDLHQTSRLTDGYASDRQNCELHLSLLVAQEHWMNVIITVHDINDHEPYFPIAKSEDSYYTINVSESATVGDEVTLIGAKDFDAGPNAVQSYLLRGSELSPNLFSLSYQPPFSLILIILAELDAETTSNYTGELVACDGGQPIPRCGVQPFRILVTDLNDNKPVFSESVYEVKLNETVMPRTTILRLDATDADSGMSGTVRYRLSQPVSRVVEQHFALNEISGELYTIRSLDAGEHPQIVIPVQAIDGGTVPLIGQAVVRVTVADVNDHAPWIQIRPVQSATRENDPVGQTTTVSTGSMLSVKENQPFGTHIGLIIVGDDDVGDNSVVTCRLNEPSQRFYLEHANSGKGREIYRLSTNQSFDREQLSDGRVHVNIVCSDKGSPAKSTEKSITVQVLDENEFAPDFTEQQRQYSVSIEEGKPPGTFVFKAEASDLDATPKIQYRLSREAQSFFHLNSSTGVITTRVVLDRETTPMLRFSVRATDEVSYERESNSAVANITVFVTDVNDNAPQLSENRLLSIVENRPGFSDLVGQLTAVDKDAGQNGSVRYRLLQVLSHGEVVPNDTFMINKESGKLFTLHSLDREQFDQYQLHVMIYDMGEPESRNKTEVIIVNVLDENDNRPQWEPVIPLLPEVTHTAQQTWFKHEPRLLGLTGVHDLGLLNISLPLFHDQPIAKFAATDQDAPYNANMTFHLLASYFTRISDVKTIQRVLNERNDPSTTTRHYFDVIASTGELIVSSEAQHIEPGLVEIYSRVTDNGNPPFDSTARLFVQINPSSMAGAGSGSQGRGIILHLLTTGHLGIALTIIIVFIMCLTAICLVVAFISVKQNRNGKSGCTCCRSNEKHSTQNNLNLTELQLNAHSTAVDEGLTLDHPLGRLYHARKSGTLLSDGGSLYRWAPDGNSYTVANLGVPPMYNLSVLNGGTLDRMHRSHTGSDKSEAVLLPFELPCPNSHHMFDERAICNEHVSLSPCESTVHCDLKRCDAQTNQIAMEQFGPEDMSSGSKAIRLPLVTNEVDGGSADSGQGASEEEALAVESSRRVTLSNAPNTIMELPLLSKQICPSVITTMSNEMPFRGPPLFHQTATLTRAGPYAVCRSQTPVTVTTFTDTARSPEWPRASHSSTVGSNPPSPPCILPPPPPLSSYQTRWHKPLFNGDEYGHRNDQFEDFRTKPPVVVSRQSCTLPPVSRLSPSFYSPSSNNNASIGKQCAMITTVNGRHQLRPYINGE